MSNEAEIAKLVGVMAAAFPSANVSDATIEVYIAMLRDIPLEILTVSVQQCMAESEFMPTIAKIREKSIVLTTPIAPEPLEAWGEVQKEITRTGAYRSPKFDDPLIAKAVDCIGWQNLCLSENQGVDRAHFAKVYEGLLRQTTNDRKLLPVAREIQSGVRKLISDKSMEAA